jgi:hypothetical protein
MPERSQHQRPRGWHTHAVQNSQVHSHLVVQVRAAQRLEPVEVPA